MITRKDLCNFAIGASIVAGLVSCYVTGALSDRMPENAYKRNSRGQEVSLDGICREIVVPPGASESSIWDAHYSSSDVEWRQFYGMFKEANNENYNYKSGLRAGQTVGLPRLALEDPKTGKIDYVCPK